MKSEEIKVNGVWKEGWMGRDGWGGMDGEGRTILNIEITTGAQDLPSAYKA